MPAFAGMTVLVYFSSSATPSLIREGERGGGLILSGNEGNSRDNQQSPDNFINRYGFI
jgi:hypothetical protein